MKRELREQARQLRQNGISVREISRTLGVSKGSVSVWVRDIELTEDQIEQLKTKQHRYGAQNEGSRANRKKFMKMRRLYQEEGRAKAREERSLHMAGCMLYWAEGAKKRGRVYFVNSDPNMMTFFIRFLRTEMGVADEHFTITIHCHATDLKEIYRIEQYWLDLLHLPPTALRKTQIKQGSDTRRNRLENGLCGLGVNNTQLVQHIYGAIQEYGGFENLAWLD
ncbi:MAG: hypothetical protein H6672_11420 [Anaerolineaceae bacterium]|nr:hypothetical protein [Anaerolineaceae bacterium]